MHFKDEVKTGISEMTAWRRRLHEMPELSFEEVQTTEFIIETLGSIPGIEIKRPAKTGALAVLKGTAPGKGRVILLRADIDALPIEEENDLPFRSKKPGVMHACGHDGHTAMMLEAAKILAAHRNEFSGEVRFLFQHAEELPPGGAAELEAAGIMEGVDELYGMHLSTSFPTGTFGVRAGALTSATDKFTIHVKGKGGHSAFPEMTVDPIVTAAQIVTALQTVVSRNIRAVEPAVLSVCEIHAGDAYNIIPDEVELVGSTRTFSEETRNAVPEDIKRISEGICSAAGAGCECEFSRGYASVINDKKLTADCRDIIVSDFGEKAALDIDPIMPGEDFSALQKDCPGFFVELGARSEAKGITAPHHNGHYLMDEDALPYGLQYWVDLVMSRLGTD